jgi:hypothetical protein
MCNELILSKSRFRSLDTDNDAENLHVAADIIDVLIYFLKEVQKGNWKTISLPPQNKGRPASPNVIQKLRQSVAGHYKMLREVFLIGKTKSIHRIRRNAMRCGIVISVNDISEWDKYDRNDFESSARQMLGYLLDKIASEQRFTIGEQDQLRKLQEHGDLQELLNIWKTTIIGAIPEFKALPFGVRRRVLKNWVSWMQADFTITFNIYPTIRDLRLYQRWERQR